MDGFKKVHQECIFTCPTGCIDCGDIECLECDKSYVLVYGECIFVEGCIEPDFYLEDGPSGCATPRVQPRDFNLRWHPYPDTVSARSRRFEPGRVQLGLK